MAKPAKGVNPFAKKAGKGAAKPGDPKAKGKKLPPWLMPKGKAKGK